MFPVGHRDQMIFDVSDEKVRQFAEVTGDHNPVHVDEEFAKTSVFGRRVAHGMLSAGFISAFLAARLPGPGAIYRRQTLKFLKPIYVGEKVTIVGEVTALQESRGVYTIQTQVFKEDGTLAVEGEATAIQRI